MKSDLPPPTLRLGVDKEALASNWRTLNEMSGTARAGAAIKANCYGLGIAECLPTLRDAGARDFYVAHWQEAPAALEHVPANQISVLHGVLTSAEAEFARATGVRPVINSLHQAQVWNESGGGLCDLMVDTGINRLGIAPSEVNDPTIASLDVHTLMSHLACADEDCEMNAWQLGAFREVLSKCEHQDASLANSAGIALGSDYAFDLTRPGLALYGGVPRFEFAGTIKQVAFPEAVLIQTRKLRAGESVGYNATFTAPHDMKVGVVSLGYADGILRTWGMSAGAFMHNGVRLPVLGKVSMDMVVVDLSKGQDLTEGDWVSLPYDLPDAAQRTGLSQYELLTVLGPRLR